MKDRRHTAAFTMIELLVAIAVAAVVTVGIYALYDNYVRAYASQDRVIQTQQTARVAVDTLTQDILRAGYRVQGTQAPFVAADVDDLTIEFFNPQARDLTTGAVEPQAERVRYFLNGTELRRQVFRLVPGTPPTWSATPEPRLSGVMASDVRFADLDDDGVQDPSEAPALEFTYYTQAAFQTNASEPAALATPAAAGELANIRQVRITVTVRSSQRDPVTGRFVFRTLRADVKPRNAGLMATIQDNDPPATPTGLASVDPGDCGFLNVSWNENDLTVDPDLAGYTLYYGTTSGVYLNSVTVPRGTSHSAASPYVLGGVSPDVQHYIAIAAYDYSGNSSPLSSPLTGTVGSADTTPNVADPSGAPASISVSAGAGDNKLVLTWAKVPDPDIIGYYVHRKQGAITSADLSAIRTDPENPTGLRPVANPSMFAPSLTPNISEGGGSFTLTDTAEVLGCVDYHYAVTAVKGCNHPISGYADSLFARTTSPGLATDTTKPDEPILTTYPSYLRNYLSIVNPSSLDFTRSHIAYSSGGTHPTISADSSTTPPTVTTNGTFIECPENATSYGPGTFTGGGTDGIIHTGQPCDGLFHLTEGATYYYTAVAVDTCSNLSTPSVGVSQVAAEQCADETEAGHPAVGNPPKVENIRGKTAPTAGASTSQATIQWDSIDFSFNQVRDFAGYRVFKTEGDTTSTPFPTRTDIDDGKGFMTTPSVVYTGLVEGRIHRIRVLAIDCETLAKDDASHTFLASRYPSGEFDAKASDTWIFYPGRVTLDTTVPVRTTGKTRNVVDFQLRNSINAAATASATEKIGMTRLEFDWVTPNSGLGVDRKLKSVTIYNGVDTFTITPSSPLASPAAFSGSQLGGAALRGATNLRVELAFVNATTGNENKASMTDYRVTTRVGYLPVMRLTADAEPLTTLGSEAVTDEMTIPASRGPEVLGTFTYDRFKAVWNDGVLAPNQGPLQTAGYPVDVAAYLRDHSGKGIAWAKVYYATGSTTQTNPPDVGSGFPTTISASYTPITMCDSDGGTAPPACPSEGYPPYAVIPAQLGKRVWLFTLVEDKNGNIGSGPPQDSTTTTAAFTYDQ